MDENKKKEHDKAGSSQETEDKKSNVSNSNSSLDYLETGPRKSRHYLEKTHKRVPKQKKKRRATGRVQKKKTKLRRKPRPRYMEKRRRLNKKSTHRKLKKKQDRKERHARKKTASVTCQMGPPSYMFSKLFVGCSPLMSHNPGYADHYKEISPEMIYRALHDLAMWRDAIPTKYIFDFIQKRYPINPNTNEAMEELLDKLRVAQIAGIAWALPNDCWRLTTALEKVHRLDYTHVTLFWKAYWNTMKPLDRNRQNCLKTINQEATTENEKVTDDYDINDII